jgi:hypothetical protein
MESVSKSSVSKGKGKGKGKGSAQGAIRKKKVAKPKANPFRRSETGKLQLKRLQMGKRIETLGPRVAQMRERFETAETRLAFVSGKLKLVEEELASRAVAPVEVPTSAPEASEVSDDEEIELDDEVEDEDETLEK